MKVCTAREATSPSANVGDERPRYESSIHGLTEQQSDAFNDASWRHRNAEVWNMLFQEKISKKKSVLVNLLDQG